MGSARRRNRRKPQAMSFDLPENLKAKLPLAAQKLFVDNVEKSMHQGDHLGVAMTRAWGALDGAGWKPDPKTGRYAHAAPARLLKNDNLPTPTPREKPKPRRRKQAKAPEPKPVDKRKPIEFSASIEKTDEDQRLVFGWASVIEKNGEQVIDRQGDVIEEATLIEAAHKFISDARVGKMMHSGEQIAEIVQSMVFTKDLQAALGVSMDRVGWFIAMKIQDDAVWKRVKSGELAAFSIGGLAASEEI